MERLLTVSEAAHALGGISKYTVQAWLSSGRLVRTKVGSRTMIRESDLQSVIEVGGKSERARGKATKEKTSDVLKSCEPSDRA